MTRLTKVELRRLFSRRLVLAAMVAGLALSVAMVALAWNAAQPMSAAEIEQAEQQYEFAMADWEEHGEEQIAMCEEAEAADAERTGEAVDYGCDQPPQREWFLLEPPTLAESLPGLLGAAGLLVLVLAVLAGTTFTAAEMSTGAISTWLTFAPRRVRVYVSKILAAGLGLLPLGAAVVVTLVGGAWAVHAAEDVLGTITGDWWGEVAAMAARIVVVTALGALVGAALGVLLRHTAAVLGLVAGYLVIVEMVFSQSLGALQQLMVSTNVRAWIEDGATYYLQECTSDSQGTLCEMVEQTLPLSQGALYLFGLTAVLVVATGLVFRRRDAA